MDLQLRRQLQGELLQLQRKLGITFIMVTHDQEEALVMSDRIAVMNAGNIEQLGSAREIYERPRTRFVAQFIGQCNVLAAEVEPTSNCHVTARTALGDFSVANLPTDQTRPGGFVAIRPEKIKLHAAPDRCAQNCFPAQVEAFTYCGAETQYRLRAGDQPFNVVVMNREAAPAFRTGTPCSASCRRSI